MSSDDDRMMPEAYTLRPPPWRPRLHPGSKAIGVPDLFRPDEDRPEMDMSETVVRNGLSLKPVVANETFSAHEMIHDRLKARGVVANVAALFDEVLTRRLELNESRKGLISDHQFKQPPRVTLNDVKLNAYIKDLADPAVPLHRLARSVPHGFRGEKMLEMLWSGHASGTAGPRGAQAIAAATTAVTSSSSPTADGKGTGEKKCVDIDRAIWFIRVVGASEIASSKARQSNVASYTAEWTSIVTGWLKRQIGELTSHAIMTGAGASSPAMTAGRSATAATPTATFPGLNRGSAGEQTASLLLDPEAGKRWIAKWTYSLTLVRALSLHRLLDRRAIIRWVLDQLRAAHPWQAPFVLALVQEHFEFASGDIQMLHYLIDTVCQKLSDYDKTPIMPNPALVILELKRLLAVAFDTSPEAFIHPLRWIRHGSLIRASLLDVKLLDERLVEVENRNMGLIEMKTSKLGNTSKQMEEYKDVQLLDSFQSEDDVLLLFTSLSFSRSGTLRSTREKIATLFTWGTTKTRSGIHRPILAARLLHLLDERWTKAKGGRGRRAGIEKLDLDSLLMDWIASVDAAVSDDHSLFHTTDLASLVTFVSELIRIKCFSFPRYIQRLTARGLTASTSSSKAVKSNAQESLLVKLLRSVAVQDCPAPLELQRRTAIYGNRTKESYEEAMERRASRELLAELPWLQPPLSMDVDTEQGPLRGQTLPSTPLHVPHFWSSSRYVKHRLIERLIMGPIRSHGPERLLSHSGRLESLSHLLSDAGAFADLYEITELCLYSHDTNLIGPACAILLRHSLVWASLRDPSPLLQRIAALVGEGSMSSGLQMVVAVRTLSNFGILQPSSPRQVEEPSGKKDLVAPEDLREAIRSLRGNQNLVSAESMAKQIASRSVSVERLLREIYTQQQEASNSSSSDSSQNDNLLPTAWLVDVVASSLQFATLDDWDDAVKTVIETEQESLDRLIYLVNALVGLGIVSPQILLYYFWSPLASLCAQGKADEEALKALAASIELSIQAQPSALSPLRGTSLSLLLRREHRETFATFLANLGILRSINGSAHAKAVSDLVFFQPQVRAALYQDLLGFVGTTKSVCVSAWRAGVNLNSEAILPEMLLLLEDDSEAGLIAPSISHPIELDHAHLLRRLNPFCLSQTLAELASTVLDRLERPEGGLQGRAQTKLQTLVRCSFDCFFSGREELELGMSLLRQSSAKVFAGMVLEEVLGRLLTNCASSSESMVDDVGCEANTLYALLTDSIEPRITISASGTASLTSLLRNLVEQIETSATAVDAATAASPALPIRTVVRLVNLLLLIDNLWTSASRPFAFRLFSALVKLCVITDLQTLGGGLQQGENCDEDVPALLLDTATVLLVQLPADVAWSCLNLAKTNLPVTEGMEDEPLLSFTSPPLSNEVLRRLIWLFGPTITPISTSFSSAPSTSGPGAMGTARASSSSMTTGSLQNVPAAGMNLVDVQASSASAAFVHGHFLTLEERPWDWHDDVNQVIAPESLASTRSLDGGGIGGANSSLSNTGSISLARFGAVKTRNRVPTMYENAGTKTNSSEKRESHEAPPMLLDSELSYGEGWGGEALYARDARRGVVGQGDLALAFGGGMKQGGTERDTKAKDESASLIGPKRKRSPTGTSETSETSKMARSGTVK